MTDVFDESPPSQDQIFSNLKELLEVVKGCIQRNTGISKEIYVFDGKCLVSNAEILSVEVKISIFTDVTEENKLILIVRDTTQRDILATLESNNRFKDNVLASVSHELRTPLNGVKALIDSCIDDPTVTHETKQIYIAPVARCATLLSFIINDVLDYSLLSSQKLRMNIKKVNIFELLQSCYDLMRDHYSQQNIDFQFKYDHKGIPSYMETDPDRLTQVIFNLLSNAFKFSYSGEIILMAKIKRKCLKISVKDTGVGMDDETIERLSNISTNMLTGEKVSSTSTGIGLGLTVCQAIALLLGPKNTPGLHFKSKLNVGSRFSFLIENKQNEASTPVSFYKTPSLKLVNKNKEFRTPLKERDNIIKSFNHLNRLQEENKKDSFEENSQFFSEKRKTRGENITVPVNLFNKSRSELYELDLGTLKLPSPKPMEYDDPEILLVDDEPINILALEMLFKQIGKKVNKAYGAEEAIQLIDNKAAHSLEVPPKSYKLIFMDLNMPKVDGFAATLRIKDKIQKKVIQDIVIVACTAYPEQEYKQKCVDMGMKGFINKPVTKAKLIEVLKEFDFL